MELNSKFQGRSKEDYELVVRAATQNDATAYTELLRRYKEPLFKFFVKMTGRPEDAEDLTIISLSKAFQGIHSYKPDYPFATWLFRIATNTGIDYLRKKRVHTRSIDELKDDEEGRAGPPQIVSEDLSPEENLIIKERNEQLRVIIQNLKPRYRTLLEMRYYEQLSYEEIAERTALPVGTVKALLFRGRMLIAQMFRGKG